MHSVELIISNRLLHVHTAYTRQLAAAHTEALTLRKEMFLAQVWRKLGSSLEQANQLIHSLSLFFSDSPAPPNPDILEQAFGEKVPLLIR